MSTAVIPKFNKSLKAFSGVIQLCAILGVSMAVIGMLWIVSGLDSGQPTDLWFPILLAYTGQGFIGLAIAGALLRHTAKVIVDGLGGTLRLELSGERPDYPSEQNAGAKNQVQGGAWSEIMQGEIERKLNDRQLRAWDKAGRPDLRSYAENPDQNFFDWLLDNK